MMHRLNDDRSEPFTCPECSVVSVAEPRVRALTCRSCGHEWLVRRVAVERELELSDDERAAVTHVAVRLRAVHVSLYRSSDGLRAYVVDSGGGEHTGVSVAPH
jgi:ribosomal protein L37AE/L43A